MKSSCVLCTNFNEQKLAAQDGFITFKSKLFK